MDIENISALIFGFFVAILLLDFNTLEKTVSKQEDNFNQNYDQFSQQLTKKLMQVIFLQSSFLFGPFK